MFSVVAPAVDRGLQHLAHEVEVGAGGVLGRELDVVGVAPGRGPRPPAASAFTCSGVIRSLCFMCVSLVAMKTWMRARSACCDGLPAAVDVGEGRAGQAADDRARGPPAAMACDRLEVALAGDREAGLDDVDAEAGELLGDLELLAHVERDARRLLAVAQRGVEDDHSLGQLMRIAFRGVGGW